MATVSVASSSCMFSTSIWSSSAPLSFCRSNKVAVAWLCKPYRHTLCASYGSSFSDVSKLLRKVVAQQSYHIQRKLQRYESTHVAPRALAYRWDDDDDFSTTSSKASFGEGVALFNAGEYYRCHDVLEELWHGARDPQRSILHSILQCAVGLYHLLNQNHKGAMMELGEGVSRMQRLRLTGSLKQFAESSSSLLEFVYNTQLEHAACAGDTCVTMDGSEQSYELLGNYGAGKVLYQLVTDVDGRLYLQFCPQGEGAVDSVDYPNMVPQRVALPYLQASEADLRSYS